MPGALLILQDLPAWMADARPASFRGVPFYWVTSAGTGGRRKVVHEFPLRDDPFTEDLGKLPRRFRMRGFVIGETYTDDRDALIRACEDYDDAATLVHPTMGEITCQAGVLGFTESIEHGGYCLFELDFVRDGPQPSPTSAADPASALIAGVNSLLPLIADAYAAIELAIVSPFALLQTAATAMLALPATTVIGLAATIAAIAAAPENLAATAAAVQAAASAMADNVVGAAATTPTTDDPVAGQPLTLAPSADLSGGLAALATWGNTLPAVGGAGPQATVQAAQQAAVISLVQGNAVAALAQIYAAIEWPTAQAATAARTQLLALLDAQVWAAANAGADQLYLAWEGMIALAMQQMIQGAQGLPTLLTYSLGDAFPSVVLGQMFYQDPSRGPQLELLNDVPDPLFMPPVGLALSA